MAGAKNIVQVSNYKERFEKDAMVHTWWSGKGTIVEQSSQDLPKQNFENVENKFFLSDDDPRLQEGVNFFKRTETDEEISSWWKEMRPKMLNIIHSKVKTFKHRVLFNNKRKRRK
ncbi:uncharacterized protein LOC111632497 [Centruroides sculpturatus]|uniref:uncharacterized protein LOC111632497 n=1 Tax=Centruroides sculpturatus TaxID=218467 RepID=UPI000C6E9F6B|nr:uncharacterized protein LOC111632497 [Centruroides sculpturatus]